MYFYWDWTYLLILPATVLALWAQAKVSNTFAEYSKVQNSKGYTGAQVAKEMLSLAGINDVTVDAVRGRLTDHYDPRTKTVRLSEDVYNSTSLSAISVAAHETGHAMQHNQGYVPLSIRSSIFPFASIGSSLSWPLIFFGLLFGMSGNSILLQVGILLFSFTVLFQIVTLPVEFNASKRALDILERNCYLQNSEMPGAKKVLNSAAMTYVAAAAVGISQLLRLLVIFNRRND